MKTEVFGLWARNVRRRLWMLVVICLPLAGQGAQEQTFPVLQIGTRVYTNVTVTTTAKDYVFLLHSAGMNNIKIAELPDDVRLKLGYAPAKKVSTNSWAEQALAKVESPQVKAMEQQLSQALTTYTGGAPIKLKLDLRLILSVLGVLFLGYLFWCYCLALICKKVGKPGGVLVWLPLLQVFPIVRAAGMSGWWGLAFFVPVLNLIAQILWCVKIAEARGKSMLCAILLILPVTNPVAILYLAFSGVRVEQKPAKRQIQLMTLETA